MESTKNQKMNIKFEFKKLKKRLTDMPKTFFDLRDDFLALYENDYTFKFDKKEIPMDQNGFTKVMDYIIKQPNPVIVVEKENILSGEVDSEEDEEEEEKEKDNLDGYDEVEEEELPHGNWTTILGVKSLTSEEKLKVSKKGRKEIEEENNMRESYEKLKKDINLEEKRKLEDMTYKDAIVVLHTKILPAEKLIDEIEEKNLFSKNEVTNFGKKIFIMKKNCLNIIKKKEEELSQLETFKINQQELGAQREQEISEIQKRYNELQEAYKEVFSKLVEEAKDIKNELESQKKLNNKMAELVQDNEQLNKELEEERNLNQQLSDMDSRLKPMEDEMHLLKDKINDITSISINYKKEKEELLENISQLNNKKIEELTQDNNSKADLINKLNNDINNLKQNKGISLPSNDELGKNYEKLLKEKEKLNSEIQKLNKEKHDIIKINDEKIKILNEKQLKIIKNLNEIYKKSTKELLDKYKQKAENEIRKMREELINSNK